MHADEARVTSAGGARAFDEPARPQREELRAHDARGLHPAGQTDHRHQQRDRRLEDARRDHEQRQPRHREHCIGAAHEHGIDRPAGVAGRAADDDARGARDRRREETDGERHARAEEHAREDIASQIVGAEPVRRRRWLAPVLEIETIGWIGRDARRDRRGGDQTRDEDAGRARDRDHAIVMRGSIAACAASATTLKRTIAVEVSISSAISTL